MVETMRHKQEALRTEIQCCDGILSIYLLLPGAQLPRIYSASNGYEYERERKK
jgi:hypothetical protein